MPKNYKMSRAQRAQAKTMLKSERRAFEDALRSAPNSRQAARISGASFSNNLGTASAGSAAG